MLLKCVLSFFNPWGFFSLQSLECRKEWPPIRVVGGSFLGFQRSVSPGVLRMEETGPALRKPNSQRQLEGGKVGDQQMSQYKVILLVDKEKLQKKIQNNYL